jgi:hypothetical protein
MTTDDPHELPRRMPLRMHDLFVADGD